MGIAQSRDALEDACWYMSEIIQPDVFVVQD
jgi:hypothetical protein